MKKGKRIKDSKTAKNVKVRFGIRSQIVVCFIVPILSVIIVGMFSYSKAESGMEKNYTEWKPYPV